VLDLAERNGVAAVATNDVRFLARSDFEAHEARVCIHDGALLADAGRVRRYSEEQYLKSPQEMAALFADAPELLANTVEVAKRCSLEIRLGASMLPAYPVPAGSTTEDYLRSESQRGLSSRLAAPPPQYLARLALELDVICAMGFAGYFLIVADFIRWARDNGVPVGPGRGSGAGSLGVHAGFRRGFLHGWPRPRDRLRGQ
jgi:DNA polymerase-3 subunit alpha